MTVATRPGRQARISQLLHDHAVRSQAELLALLAADGIDVTQATLSRDLLDLRAEKVRVGRDLVYAVPGEGGDRTPRAAVDPAETDARLRRLCEELLVTAEVSAQLVVVRTPPGAASYLGSAIDHARLQDVIGTIAGDDTLMIITTNPSAGRPLADRLLALGSAGTDGASTESLKPERTTTERTRTDSTRTDSTQESP